MNARDIYYRLHPEEVAPQPPPTTFLLPGRPVYCSLTSEALCAYLRARGEEGVDGIERLCAQMKPDLFASFCQGFAMAEAQRTGRHPLDVLADAGGVVVSP